MADLNDTPIEALQKRLHDLEKIMIEERTLNARQEERILDLLKKARTDNRDLKQSRTVLLAAVAAIFFLILRVDAQLVLYGQNISITSGITDTSWVDGIFDELIPFVLMGAGGFAAYRQRKNNDDDGV